VAGLDVAFAPGGGRCVAAAVVWDLRDQQIVEEQVAWRKTSFPYVPGLLSFREVPVLLAALRKLRHCPDVLMCDGQGRAHPRRFGIACHVGLIADVASVGCAKSRLIGVHAEPGSEVGSRQPLVHDGEHVGYVLRTRRGCRPLFVSAGHRLSLEAACALVIECCAGHWIPEPTRLADRLVRRERTIVWA
jgi:deoxyribonuclease V